MAGKNAAKWLEDGKIIDVPGPELFAHHWEVEIPEFGKLEGYPNRNSVPYVDIYGIKIQRQCSAARFAIPAGALL